MVVKKLDVSGLRLLREFYEWMENNDIDEVRKMMDNKMGSVFVLMDGDKVLAACTKSYRATALGQPIMQGAAHVYGLVISGECMTDYDAMMAMLPKIWEQTRKDGYKHMIASCPTDDEEYLSCLKSAGFSQVLGELTFYNEFTGSTKTTILSYVM